MSRLLKAAAFAAASMSLCACATVTRGTHTAWEVQTTPPGATVKTTNGMSCDSTPCSLRMERKSDFSATISKPGYKSVNVQVHHKVSGSGGAGMAGNVLVGGLIGAGVDVASGAMLDLTPNPVVLALERDIPVEAAPIAPVATTPAVAPVAPAPAVAPASVASSAKVP